MSTLSPPLPRRDESAMVWAGNVTTRELNGSDSAALLDPPASFPDPYGWLRDDKRESKEILDHLEAENAYSKSITSHLEGARKALYDEMLSFVKETDFTSPVKRGDYLYYVRTFEGKSYKVYCRAPIASLPASGSIDWSGLASDLILEGEVVLLDCNALAEGKDYCVVGSARPSPSKKLYGYTVDNTGNEEYQVFVKNIESGEMVESLSSFAVTGSLTWGKDDQTFYYEKMDAAMRPYQVWKHTVGTSPDSDVMLFEDKDELFYVSSFKSLDGKFLFIDSSSSETSEVHYIDLESGEMHCVAPRRKKVLYGVEHREGFFYIATNEGGLQNLKLVSVPVMPNGQDQWVDVTDAAGNKAFDGGPNRPLSEVLPLANHLVCFGREEGIPRVWTLIFEGQTLQKMERIEFEEDTYDVSDGGNAEYDANHLQVTYDSLVTPLQYIKINLSDVSDRQIVKKTVVPNYDPTLYHCERKTVLSRDGKTQIPVSMVYRKDTKKPEGEPQNLHLYGYGSYGVCIECDFRSSRLPLLDRGIIYAIAHVRGGGEMGRQWYEMPEGGKYTCKKNTFNDYIDCARYFISTGLTEPSKLSAEGRSAGGLLMGASINQAPELFKAAIYGVPFVDVVATMVDSTIPLTTGEWEEWGNPNEKEFFQYMMEYSPMQNVKPNGVYPAILLTGGLHDPRVQYWEPAKLAAELRHTASKESGPVCLKLQMTAGHFSASDRYKYYEELAFDWAFVLDHLGLSVTK